MALLAIAVWLRSEKHDAFMVILPMIFMFIVTFVALAQVGYAAFVTGKILIGSMSVVLFLLAIALVFQSFETFKHLK